MGKIDAYALREAWSLLKKQLHESGFSLRRGVCFEELEANITCSGKPVLTEHFSTEKNTYTPGQAFWISVETFDGRIVGRVAARLDDLGDQTLVDYWRRYWRRCYPAQAGGQAEMAQDQPRYASNISGRVAYVGDLYVEKAFRGKGVGAALVKIVQIDALDEWMPNYLYGWMTPEHAQSGLLLAYGFRAVHEGGIRWLKEPGTIGGNLVFVGNDREDLADLIDQITT